MKRKHFFGICVCLLIWNFLQAQSSHGKFTLNLSAGLALPVGDFGKKTYTFIPDADSSFGLAKTGPAFNVSVHYEATKNLSVGILSSFSLNKQDENSIKSFWNPTNPNSSVDVTVGSWKVFSLMLGGGYIIKTTSSRGIYFVPSAYVGMNRTIFPGNTVVLYTDVPGMGTIVTGTASQLKASMRWAACYQLGSWGYVPLSSKWLLTANAFYFSTAKLRSADYENDPKRFKVSTVNVLIGLSLRL